MCAVYLHFSVCPPLILLKVILRDGDVIAKPTDADQSSDGRRGVCVCGGEETHTPDPKGEKRKIQLTNHRHALDDDDDDDQEERWK